MRFLIRDSRGKPSWTCTLAIPAVLGITTWFVLGGLDVTLGSGESAIRISIATKTAAEYAMAVGVWLVFFGQREYVEKKNGGRPPAGGA